MPEQPPRESASHTVPELVARLRAAGCVFAEDEAALLVADGRPVDELARRRTAGEPLEHVLGWVEFAGLRLAVGAGVFVPRQRTLLLVDETRRRMRADSVVVELCAGVAAISAAVLHSHPRARVTAVELDPLAASYAARNLDGRGAVLVGDLDAPLPHALAGRVDVLVADAPYVPSAELALLPPEARDHEPRRALDGGADGLDLARRIVAAAPRWLAPGGVVLIETSRAQAARLAEIMHGAGLEPELVRDDERDATAVVGSAPPSLEVGR